MENAIEKVDPAKAEKQIEEFKPNPAFVSAGALLPKSYQDVMTVATIMAKSNMVPKEMVGRPETCANAILFGMGLGLDPAQSVQSIMVVNNRPSLWGDAVKALIIGSGKCETFDEDPPHVALKQGFGRCRLVRKKEFGGGELEIQFSSEDAKRAKLWTKPGPWQDYPGRMLMFRARGWACRDLFPDVLKGMQMREELADYEIIHPPVQMPIAKNGPSNVQDATLVGSGHDTPKEPSNALESKPGVEIQASGESEPSEKQLDPSLRITDDRRKGLFQKRSQAKIDLAEAKMWLKEQGLNDTSELTNGLADAFEKWIEANRKG